MQRPHLEQCRLAADTHASHSPHSRYPSEDGSASSESGRLVKIRTGEPFFPAPPPDLKARWLTYSTLIAL